MIGKSGSPPRCAGRCRSDFAENDVQIAVARKLQVQVVIATPLVAFSSAPRHPREVEGRRAGKRFARPERLGLVKKYQKMDRGKKTGYLRDDFIRGIASSDFRLC